MALDGILLHAITNELQIYLPAKINKIQQISNDEILFILRSQSKNFKLMISCHSVYNRIHISNKNYTTLEHPQNFVMLLRKYIDRAIITEIQQVDLDRILRISVDVKDELGDFHSYFLYVELMGKYANLVLVNDEARVIDALKRIPGFETSTRTIHPGAHYSLPTPHTKMNPFEEDNYTLDSSFVKQFHGFSPLLSDEVHYRMLQGENFREVINTIKESKSIYITKSNDDYTFHLLPLLHLHQPFFEMNLFDAMDFLFFDKEEKIRIKQQSGNLFKLVRQELKKNRNKLIKLQRTLDDANELDQYRLYGDLLYAYPEHYNKHQNTIEVYDYENNKNINIVLDDKLSVKQNAKKYYTKYNKSKTAQIEMQKQIHITRQAIAYFENIEIQLLDANLADASEIKEELAKKGYIKKHIEKIRKKKQNVKPNFITLLIDDTYIYVGKNNMQNDYITWTLAKRNDTWLHVKDMHGSHVLIASEKPNEKILRTAAILAAFYSEAKNSSSVPVNYCPARLVRKPNSAQLGFVTLTHYKTIFIDPNEEEVNQILQTYQIK